MNFQPWKAALILKHLSLQLKQELPLPDYVVRISEGTSNYEEQLRRLWSQFKEKPNKTNAKKLAKFIKEKSDEIWREETLKILGVNELSEEQEQLLQEELTKHHDYIDNSLLPDIIKGIDEQLEDFPHNLDYRVIFLYSGALWKWGFLLSIMYDGFELRDMADLFMFLGPKDEGNCTGLRGCKQHVGKVYTVLQILQDRILPGELKCLTNCRHMLIPVASPLGE